MDSESEIKIRARTANDDGNERWMMGGKFGWQQGFIIMGITTVKSLSVFGHERSLLRGEGIFLSFLLLLIV